jgi:hypothetical protein
LLCLKSIEVSSPFSCNIGMSAAHSALLVTNAFFNTLTTLVCASGDV